MISSAKSRRARLRAITVAVVSVLAPICVQQFRAQPDAVTQLETLDKLPGYDQGPFVEKGGWATMPGAEKAMPGVARGCATILTAKT